jgi:curli production assembly/transport component CsgG/holdfast attachment protein HfaB
MHGDRHLRTCCAAILAGAALAGCARSMADMPNIEGPPVKEVETPYKQKLSCFKNALPKDKTMQIAVGRIQDSTGKFNYDKGSGYWITQGATDILSTAMYMSDRTQLVERAQTKILEWEMDLANKKVLGDYRKRVVRGPNGETKTVTYRSLGEGKILGSDYYLVGSINRLDLTTKSADVNARVAGVGPSARGFVMQVGLDVRAVNTETGIVAAAVSLDKQIIGESYGVGIGRIFGTTLVELGAEVKRVEPMHVALKGMLQEVATRIMADLYDVAVPQKCRKPVQEMQSRQLVVDPAGPDRAQQADRQPEEHGR